MKLSGIEIQKMYEYVKENGLNKEYTIGNAIPSKSNIGYYRYISTSGSEKCDVADSNLF